MPQEYNVILGKDDYCRQDELIKWCQTNIGKGCWIQPDEHGSILIKDNDWIIHSHFGNSFFSFKTEEMRSKFKGFVLQS